MDVEAAAVPDPPERAVLARRRQDRRVLGVGLVLAFGPVITVLVVLALRDRSTPLGPGLALLLLSVIVIGPLLGFVLLVVLRSRRHL